MTRDEVVVPALPRSAAALDACARADVAANGLAESAPTLSAKRVTSRGQRIILVAALGVVLAVAVIAPLGTITALIGLVTFIYLAALIYRGLLFYQGMRGGRVIRVSDEQAHSLSDEELPVYTVLIPVLHEPLIETLVGNLQRLDYPVDKLDIRLLIEADDEVTWSALEKLDLDACFTVVAIAPRQPRTKPKACNVGLLDSRGDLVTIYDAEDRPEPLQLRRAAYALLHADPQVACIQAQLSFYNSRQNLLTRWFALDYGAWFHYLLPGLEALKSPIPLGGTSNHFRAEVLYRIGAWDPWNVTEDADLGLRLHRLGYQVEVLESVTLEEANSDGINWIRQRSRWYKGYLQTLLVHLRRGGPVAQRGDLATWAGLLLFVGGTPLLAALNGFQWCLTLAWALTRSDLIAGWFPPGVYYVAMISAVLGNGLVIYFNVLTARAMGRPDLVWAAVLSPGYWFLMWLAALKAAAQLVFNPSYWEKTTHGLDEGGQHE
ncbi:glycosyltransferase family 2 protein [Propioniciclava flava]|uniref:glycosyltransferase family 2 protein n=1 Tax=Propioniciclava flava TaxID=2072026 RepID=UPI0013E99769|nr:glycosyltransferase family 2 protein [Propioniciclava flava]